MNAGVQGAGAPSAGELAVVPTALLIDAQFIAIARSNPVNAELLHRLPALGLPQCHLTAGCLFQALWNQRSGQPPDAGVSDYDVFYFDDSDLSWQAEDTVIRRAQALFAGLNATVEIRNQARVHLWYPQRFGAPYPPLQSAQDGIDRYLVECTCMGIQVDTGQLYAPHGLADLQAGRLRINPKFAQPAMFAAKAASYRQRWPWLQVV